jgi:hypothetical protein
MEGRGIVWLAAAVAFVAGCGDDGGSRGAHRVIVTAQDLSRERPVLRGPHEVPAGRVRLVLRNEGGILHDAQLFQVGAGHSLPEVAKAAVEKPDSYQFPAWARAAGGIAAVRPGKTASVVQVLTPGTYVLADTQERDEGPMGPRVSNARKGGVLRLRATGDAAGSLPATAARIVATDGGFEIEGMRPGVNRVTFENRGREPHQAVLYRIRRDVPVRRAGRRVLNGPAGVGWSPIAVPSHRATALLEAGDSQVTTMTLKPGRYLVVCHAADRAGGSPHFYEGVFATFEVG